MAQRLQLRRGARCESTIGTGAATLRGPDLRTRRAIACARITSIGKNCEIGAVESRWRTGGEQRSDDTKARGSLCVRKGCGGLVQRVDTGPSSYMKQPHPNGQAPSIPHGMCPRRPLFDGPAVRRKPQYHGMEESQPNGIGSIGGREEKLPWMETDDGGGTGGSRCQAALNKVESSVNVSLFRGDLLARLALPCAPQSRWQAHPGVGESRSGRGEEERRSGNEARRARSGRKMGARR